MNANLILIRSTVSNNNVLFAVLSSGSGTAYIENSTIADNVNNGIQTNTPMTIVNSTIANHLTSAGLINGSGSITLNHTIIANNALNCSGPSPTSFFSLEYPGTSCGIFDDQRGLLRPSPSNSSDCDLGAYETGLAALFVSPASHDYASIVIPGDSSFVFIAKNIGYQPLDIDAINTVAPFSVENPTTFPITNLLPLEEVDIDMKFEPTVPGTFMETVDVMSTQGGDVSVNVEGVGENDEIPVDEQIQNILMLCKDCVDAGELMGVLPESRFWRYLEWKITKFFGEHVWNKIEAKASKHRLKAWKHILKSAERIINKGNFAGACHKLQHALDRADGEKPPVSKQDFVKSMCLEEGLNPGEPGLIELIEQLRMDLGC